MIKIIYIVDKDIAEKIKKILDFFHYPSKIEHIKDFKLENDRGYIFIGATGIFLRKYINEIINDKYKDPFVIVVNRQMEIIPLLSSHLGGGTYFANLLARFLNGTVIYTTATDVYNKIGLDVLTNILFLEKPKRKDILRINKKILYENIDLYLPKGWNIKINGYNINYHDKDYVKVDNIKLKPLKIVVGVGCRKGEKSYNIYWLIKKALFLRNLYLWRVNAFATVELKKDEKNLLKVINEKFNKKLLFFSCEEINNIFNRYNLKKSEFVYRSIGCYGVSEPVALLGVEKLSKNRGELLLNKITKKGVSVSIAKEVEYEDKKEILPK